MNTKNSYIKGVILKNIILNPFLEDNLLFDKVLCDLDLPQEYLQARTRCERLLKHRNKVAMLFDKMRLA